MYGVLEDAVPGTLFQSAQPARHGVVDFRTQDVSREGQIALNSRRFLTLPRFAFLLGVSEQEGALPTTLQQITIADLDKDQYPDTATLTKYRAEFMRAGGVSEQALLSEIAGRLPPACRQAGRKPGHRARLRGPTGTTRQGNPSRWQRPRAHRPRLRAAPPLAAKPPIAVFLRNPAVLSYTIVLPSPIIKKYAHACP